FRTRGHGVNCTRSLTDRGQLLITGGREPPALGGGGLVFNKDSQAEEDGGAAMAEARSLDAFRSALENLEDQLEFVHVINMYILTLQVIKSQQRAERDATTMRLGQGCNILARRLAEDEGKKHVAIEMAS
ncbi:hypothetical protein GW17_00001469, partial [Ensete ventricosum]